MLMLFRWSTLRRARISAAHKLALVAVLPAALATWVACGSLGVALAPSFAQLRGHGLAMLGIAFVMMGPFAAGSVLAAGVVREIADAALLTLIGTLTGCVLCLVGGAPSFALVAPITFLAVECFARFTLGQSDKGRLCMAEMKAKGAGASAP